MAEIAAAWPGSSGACRRFRPPRNGDDDDIDNEGDDDDDGDDDGDDNGDDDDGYDDGDDDDDYDDDDDDDDDEGADDGYGDDHDDGGDDDDYYCPTVSDITVLLSLSCLFSQVRQLYPYSPIQSFRA